MSGVLSMQHIIKQYGSMRALDDVSLSVQKGETVAIIGSSGSGKSTLLRCVNHLETVSSGSIFIDGMPLVETHGAQTRYVSDKQIRKLITRTGMVFQHFNLFPHLTALENVAIGPIEILKNDKALARAQAQELLHTVGLSDKMGNYPSQLSGGQQQRVAIARALAMQPDLMLFDEPTSALDPEITGEVLSVIRNLAAQQRTMLLVTHEMGFAREVADRVVYMDAGKIIEEGPPATLLTSPQTPRLQEFLRSVL